MAVPTINFDNVEGSDTAASGAGPSTAKFGTAAATAITLSSQIAFFEGSPPDLSGVATDGSHLVWIDTSSGRFFHQITAKKDSQQTDTGDISSGTNTVSNMTDNSSMSVGDVIKIAGAGVASADLITDITVIDGGGNDITVRDNASTSQTGTALTDPKQVTVNSVTTGDVGKNWGIGGERKLLANATSLFTSNGWAAGWTVDIEETGTNYISDDIQITQGGSSTVGNVVLKSSSSTKPIITTTTTATTMTVDSGVEYITFSGLAINNDRAGASSRCLFMNIASSDQGYVIENMSFSCQASSGIGSGLVWGRPGRGIVRDSLFHDNDGWGVLYSANGVDNQVSYKNNVFQGNALGGMSMTRTVGSDIRGNVFRDNTGPGLKLNASTEATRVVGNVLHSNTNSSDGLELASADSLIGLECTNNIFTNNLGNGINASFGTPIIDSSHIDHNHFNENSGGAQSNAALAGANDTNGDPLYTNEGSNDLTIGASSPAKATGYPKSTDTIGNDGDMSSFVDIGAAQREEPAGGGGGTPFIIGG